MARLVNQNKKINSVKRKKFSSDKVDIEDPYYTGLPGTYRCQLCGSSMHPYKQDQYGDIVMACDNGFCPNNEGFDGSVNVELSKLVRELQLHSRYYTDYLGGYYGRNYNRWRKAPYMDKTFGDKSIV